MNGKIFVLLIVALLAFSCVVSAYQYPYYGGYGGYDSGYTYSKLKETSSVSVVERDEEHSTRYSGGSYGRASSSTYDYARNRDISFSSSSESEYVNSYSSRGNYLSYGYTYPYSSSGFSGFSGYYCGERDYNNYRYIPFGR